MLKWIAIGVAVLLVLPFSLVLLAGASLTSTPSTGLTDGPSVLALADIPRGYLTLYLHAAKTCPGLPWAVLAGIGTIESDNGRSNLPGVHSGANYAGAEGPMQFESATFAEFAVNADHNGPPSPYDPADAIYTAAAKLCADGAAQGKLRDRRGGMRTIHWQKGKFTDTGQHAKLRRPEPDPPPPPRRIQFGHRLIEVRPSPAYESSRRHHLHPAAAVTSANSSSVSENCTTFGRDTACRDLRRTTPSTTSTTCSLICL